MAYEINGKLRIAVSSRALFQLEKEEEIFQTKGKKEYEDYQVKHENDVLMPGAAFPLIKAILELGEENVEVIVVSRNTANTSLRVFNSIEANGLNICRGFFTGGESIVGYLKSLDIDLYLTANDKSAKEAIDNGIPAATMITSAVKYGTDGNNLRIAFDGDAVLFSDESEVLFKTGGLEAFSKTEGEKADIPMNEGPMAKFLRALSKIQQRCEKDNITTKITTALVTARSAPAHARTIKTLRSWGISVDQAFFLGGLNKNYILKEFKPQIFFDDQHLHTDRASLVIPAGTVPYKSGSKNGGIAMIDVNDFTKLFKNNIHRYPVLLKYEISSLYNTKTDKMRIEVVYPGIDFMVAVVEYDNFTKSNINMVMTRLANKVRQAEIEAEEITDMFWGLK